MKCPRCSFHNADDAPFCQECGHVFLSSDRIPAVPDPAEAERRRDEALGAVPPVVKVPDIAVPEAKPAARPTVPEVVPAAPRTSVADLVDPLPEPPREPDFSGFERLVDSSYVPPAPASSAGDTAEIPVVRDEYVPRARNYTLGLSPREQKKRDREQRKLERQFAKAQQKEEARRIREEARAAAEVAREERKAAAAAAREERLAAAAAAREERKAAEVAHAPEADEALAAGAMLAATEAAAAEMAAASEQADGAEPAPAAPDATAALKPGALELPAAETGIVPVGERAIASTAEAEAATEDEPAGALAPATGAGPLEAAGAPSAPAAPAGVETAAMAPRSASATGNPRAKAAAARAEARGAEPGDATRTDTAKSPKTVAAPAKGPSDKKTPATEKAAAPPTAQARPPRSKVPFIIGALIALIVVGGVAAAGTYMAEMWGGKTVPSVVGLPQAEAEAALADKGFAAAVTQEKSDEAPGTVLAAAPDGGRAEEGSTVELTVAVARTVPAVAGLTQQEAVDLLAAEGLSSVEVTEEKSNEATGTVLAVAPEAGTALLSTDPVTLTVAVPFTVPDVAGSSRDDAVAALEAEGYEADVQRYYTEDAEEGTAVSTDPEAGTELNSGSTVTLYIAKSRAAELRELTIGVLPGATLTTEEGTYLVKEVKSTSYKGDGEVSYTVVAVKSEVVKFPFGLGEKTYYDDKNPVTLEGGLVWNDNDKISYANPEITLP